MNKHLPSSHFSSIFVIFLILSLGTSLAACSVAPQPASAPPTLPTSATNVQESGAVETANSQGQELFGQVCAACHGPDGAGLPNLGKNLVDSKFVGGLADEQLLAYIRAGRTVDDPLNTTGVAMPPSGARPDLSDDDLLNIIAYVRTINTKAGVQSKEATQYLAQLTAAAPAPTAETDSEESDSEESDSEKTDAKEAPDTEETPVSGDAQAGQHLFAEVCAPCHGLDGKGIEGIGLDLTESKFTAALTPIQLADFIAMGRGLNSPFNFTEIKMPPFGARPDLSDEGVLDIATYLHSINKQIGVESSEATEYLAWLESGGAEKIEPIEEVSSEGLSGVALDGQTTYLRFCAVCHGSRAEGVESLGKSLIDSIIMPNLTDDELVEFISTGRSVDDPFNTTGIEMLPYGGQESLIDEELTNLVAYLRFVNAGEITVAAKSSDVEDEEAVEEEETQETNEIEASKEEAIAIVDGLAPNCFVCHLIGKQGNKDGPGPHLNGISGRAGNRVPGVSAEEYIKQSILDPGAFIEDECPAGPCVDVMPRSFGEQLSEEQLNILVNFFLSLPEEE